MFRIWAKVIKEGHIERQLTYTRQERFSYADFFGYLAEICDRLDVPTPVLMKTHLFNYAKFNHVVFLPRDYIEDIPFDKFVLENIL